MSKINTMLILQNSKIQTKGINYAYTRSLLLNQTKNTEISTESKH